MKKNQYYILMVLATFLFAGAFIAGKLGSSQFSPVLMTFLRMGMATVILMPIMAFKEGFKITKSEFLLASVLGLFGMTFYHLFFFTALKYTTASNASVINGTMPIVTTIIAFFMIKDKINKQQIFFILLAFFGVLTILTDWHLERLLELKFNIGDIIMFGGTISWALYSVLIKKYNKTLSALKLTSYTLFMCTIFVAPFALFEIFKYNSLDVPFNQYYPIIYMAIFPTVIGYTIQQACIKKIGPSTAALFVNLVPFFSIILAVIILKEPISPMSILSGGIIIFSVVSFSKSKSKKTS